MLTGGCYCGQVRYEADAPPFHGTVCHCADCRRIVGAASVAWFSVQRTAFRLSGAEPASFRSSPRVTRRFCGSCGTALTYERDDLPDEIDLTTASLDDPDLAAPADHTWTAEKLRWVELCDGLPVFPGPRAEG